MNSDFHSAVDELFTLRDWLRYAVSRMQKAGVSFGQGFVDAYDEAAYLVLHTLHLPTDRLEPFLDARLLSAEKSALAKVLERRIHGHEPAAYITGEAWLGNLRFRVDPRVLIPRSHIFALLEDELSPWVGDAETVTRVLDLCTGSACLAIACAYVFPNAQVDAVDISPGALDLARLNVADHGLEQRLELLEGDLWAPLETRRYDVIVSNPPYVTQAAMLALPEEFRHEPALALAAGEDGMDIVRRIVAQAGAHLQPDGIIVIEVGHNRAQAQAALSEFDLTWLDTPASQGQVFLLHGHQLQGA